MKKLLLLIILNLFAISSNAQTKPRILVSNIPLASIIALITADAIDLDIIHTSGGCAHDHIMKPSDLTKIKHPEVAIYINEDFEGFFHKLLNNNAKQVIKIGSILNLDLIHHSNSTNWHIWLNLRNVELILDDLKLQLSIIYPELQKKFENNLAKALSEIKILDQRKKTILSPLTDPIILNDSVEYFFYPKHDKLLLLPEKGSSVKYLSKIEQALKASKSQCLIVDNARSRLLFNKHFAKYLVQVDSENWQIDGKLANLFIQKYNNLIDQMASCLK